MISDEQIKEIWHNIPTQGDPSGMKFAIVFARAVLAAAPDSQGPKRITPENPVECTTCGGLVVGVVASDQGAPKQHFCEKPVASGLREALQKWCDAENAKGTWYEGDGTLSVGQVEEFLEAHPSDGVQAIVVDKSTPQEDK